MSLANPERTQAEICVHCGGNTAIDAESHIIRCEECLDDHGVCVHGDIKESAEFTDDDLRLIMAMCQSANPWFPGRSMMPSFASVFYTAERMLNAR